MLECYLEAGVGEFLISVFVGDVLLDVVVLHAADPALLLVLRVRLAVQQMRLVAEEDLAALGARARVELALLLLLTAGVEFVVRGRLVVRREQVGGGCLRRVSFRIVGIVVLVGRRGDFLSLGKRGATQE